MIETTTPFAGSPRGNPEPAPQGNAIGEDRERGGQAGEGRRVALERAASPEAIAGYEAAASDAAEHDGGGEAELLRERLALLRRLRRSVGARAREREQRTRGSARLGFEAWAYEGQLGARAVQQWKEGLREDFAQDSDNLSSNAQDANLDALRQALGAGTLWSKPKSEIQ